MCEQEKRVKKSNTKRNIVLSILFFLPVAFLLMLYPAKHNYVPLDVVNSNVEELTSFYNSDTEEQIRLKDHITVLAFLGKQPLDNLIATSNLKELVYDKFKGFKKFQMVLVVPDGAQDAIEVLHKQIATYEDMRFWHYVYGTDDNINQLYSSLKHNTELNTHLATNDVFIIDKDRNQRGRIDARDKKEVEANKPTFTLTGYDCIAVDEIKNKMNDDIRILFTEYRQKRKGKFDSTTRRANDLNDTNE